MADSPESERRVNRLEQRKRSSRLQGLLIAGVVAVLVVVVALAIQGVTGNQKDGEALATSSSATPSAIPYSGGSMVAKTADQKVVRDLLVKKGWSEDQLNFGALTQHAEDRGATSFSNKSLLTRGELTGYLNSGQRAAKAVRQHLRSYLSEANYGQAEARRMLSGEGWVRVQFLAPFDWRGMTYYAGNRVVVSMSARPVQAGDVAWFYVTSKHVVLPGRTVVRADCSNPAMPPSPGGGIVTPRPTPTPSKTLEPKDPSKFPKEPTPPPSAKPFPGGTLTPPPRPGTPDPTPSGGIITANPVPTPTQTAGPGIPTPLPTATGPSTPAPGPTPTHTTLPDLP